MIRRSLILSILFAAAAAPQAVRVYSEFQRVDPSGNVLAVDRAEPPREILSPALARGAWASFIIVVRPPEGRPHWLFIGQNPEHFVKVEMYRPVFEHRGDTWMPDALEPVDLDDAGCLAPVEPRAPGQAIVLWMDVWVAANAPVRRARLEIQLKSGEEWTIYPMEMRIQEAVIPPASAEAGQLAAADAPASDSAATVFRAYACGAAGKGAGAKGPLTIRSAIRRNALQDAALARSLESRIGKEALLAELLSGAGFSSAPAFCASKASPQTGRGAEWYLPIRDRLYRLASVR